PVRQSRGFCVLGKLKRLVREKPASTQLETPQPITLLIYLQRPSRLVPVPQHYPLGLAAIQPQRMYRRPVGVTMDQGGYPMGAHYPQHLVLIDVGNLQRLVAGAGLAFVAQFAA